jgi:serine/threonine protein kinase
MMKKNNETVINPGLPSEQTVINQQAALTSINDFIDHESLVKPGDKLCDKYIVQEKLQVQSGEADLFICTYGKGKYVAKVYRRKVAIKTEVTDALAGVYSPYIAQIFDLGSFNGFPVEILPYYQNGSVLGKRFSFEQLKQNIIPALNEGLRVLHDNGIIHKDLKPSNIMLNADGRTVSIIDFGISSIRDEGSTVIVTKTGMTPDYSAPETFRGLFLNESDYYSLGITIFELFTGHTPYSQIQGEELERMLSIQRIPLPEDMPSELKNLVTGLTYPDITNRKDKTNPNRRWTYEEVNNWCNGISQPIPGLSSQNAYISGEQIRPYKFLGKTYTKTNELVDAFVENWEDGKKQLFRGLLSAYFKPFDPELAGICIDAEESVDRNDADIIFFKTLYEINPDLQALVWKGQKFFDLEEFGVKLLEKLRLNEDSMDSLTDEFLTKGVLSAYYEIQHNKVEDSNSQVLKAFESKRKALLGSVREKKADNYQLAFVLSGRREFVIDGLIFNNTEQLVQHLSKVFDKDPKSFTALCDKLIYDDNTLDIQFESWLIALGKKEEIQKWKLSIN